MHQRRPDLLTPGLSSVPEDLSRLVTVSDMLGHGDGAEIVEALRGDSVVLVRGVGQSRADDILMAVAERLALREALELQAGFAASFGHRQRIGRCFMTANARADYQFLSLHSEGGSLARMQLAALLCHENTTDGGVTILMNVDESCNGWGSLREQVVRGQATGAPLTRGALAQARGLYRLDLPHDLLRSDDEILGEQPCHIPGLRLFNVLAKPRSTLSCILGRNTYAYWDTIGGIDRSSSRAYLQMLRDCGLLREPPGAAITERHDIVSSRHIIDRDIAHRELFKCRVVRRLAAGELMIWNNMSWTHSASNWSPNSGRRSVAIAFA